MEGGERDDQADVHSHDRAQGAGRCGEPFFLFFFMFLLANFLTLVKASLLICAPSGHFPSAEVEQDLQLLRLQRVEDAVQAHPVHPDAVLPRLNVLLASTIIAH